MVDTCSAEFESKTPYYYGTYETFNESKRTDKPSVVVLGSDLSVSDKGLSLITQQYTV